MKKTSAIGALIAACSAVAVMGLGASANAATVEHAAPAAVTCFHPYHAFFGDYYGGYDYYGAPCLCGEAGPYLTPLVTVAL